MLSEHFIYVRDVGDNPSTGEMLYELGTSTLDTFCEECGGELHDADMRAEIVGILPCADAEDAAARLAELHTRFAAFRESYAPQQYRDAHPLHIWTMESLLDETPYLTECCERHDRRHTT